MVFKDFIFKRSVPQGTSSVSCQEGRNLWHCSISKNFYVILLKKLQHVGHKWVICGSHLDCSVGQMGQQVRPSFNPNTNYVLMQTNMICSCKSIRQARSQGGSVGSDEPPSQIKGPLFHVKRSTFYNKDPLFQ